jgi:lipopolysaccharide/colanic/teichoic acid biosynthesis glycosyltransferase
MKRLVDILVSAAGLILLLPVLVVLAIAVAGTSPGGAFFRQRRVGRNRRPFRLLKFRSMAVRRGSEAGSFDAGDASRVTPIGRLLRKSKLDELPQLWNVLVGDMSLVGPRPEVPDWTEVHPDRWDVVLSVRPGITDPASIEFRDEESILAAADDPHACYRDEILPRKLALSEAYVRDRSFTGDLGIMLRTVAAVVGFGSRGPETEARGTSGGTGSDATESGECRG